MSLFSFFNKNKNQSKQKSTFDDGGFYARAEDTSNSGKERAKSHRSNMSNTSVDPVLPEKKRARRRLVGAIALALAAIIGLPMILDSEPKPLENDVLIQIPSRDKSFSSPKEQASTPASVPASASLSSSDTTSPAETQMPASDTLDEQEEVVPPPSPAPAPVFRAPVSNIKNQDTPSHSPAKSTRNSTQNATKPIQAQVQTQTHATRTPATTPKKAVEPLSDAAKANAILEGKTNGKSIEVEELVSQKNTRFVVQVAALTDQEKINTLQVKLKNAGIVSHTQKVVTQTGERTRIRVGPYTNKEDAEKVRIKLEKLGLNGSVLPL